MCLYLCKRLNSVYFWLKNCVVKYFNIIVYLYLIFIKFDILIDVCDCLYIDSMYL